MTVTTDITAAREQFEAWHGLRHGSGLLSRSTSGVYVWDMVEDRWHTWLASSQVFVASRVAAPVQPVPLVETLTCAERQSWELHIEQAAVIRELLDLHASGTDGNLQTRLAQVFAQAEQPANEIDPADILAGVLQVSRGYAYELMEKAVAERHAAPQPPADAGHNSDCSVHNEPAYPADPCDCGLDQFHSAGGECGGAIQPLDEAQITHFYRVLLIDPRTASFDSKGWLSAGVALVEELHNVHPAATPDKEGV